jgi:hypothetical protein
MDQIYFTSCKSEKSVSGNSGFQVRAISSGIKRDLVNTVVSYMGYSLPKGMVATEKTALAAPVRLAFLNVQSVGKILCHSVYIGKDPTTGRFGNFFSHAVINIEENFGLNEAIKTWGSSDWVKKDNGGDVKINGIKEIINGKDLDLEFTNFLKEKTNLNMFQFVLNVFLKKNNDARIFIAASPKEIALCVFGLTRVFPKPITDHFTFSTYESDPLGCIANIVGTSFEGSQGNDLPQSCYRGGNRGFNKKKGKNFEANQNEKYVTSYYHDKIHDDHEAIKFLNLCNKAQVQTLDQFLLIFKFITTKDKNEITKDDCYNFFVSENLKVNFLINDNDYTKQAIIFLQRIVDESEKDFEFHEKIKSQIITILRNSKLLKSDLKNKKICDRIESWIAINDFFENNKTVIDFKRIACGINIDLGCTPPQAGTFEKFSNRLIEDLVSSDSMLISSLNLVATLNKMFEQPKTDYSSLNKEIMFNRLITDFNKNITPKTSTYNAALKFLEVWKENPNFNLPTIFFYHFISTKGETSLIKFESNLKNDDERKSWKKLTFAFNNRWTFKKVIKFTKCIIIPLILVIIIDFLLFNIFGISIWIYIEKFIRLINFSRNIKEQ